jgi:hypothetical protein
LQVSLLLKNVERMTGIEPALLAWEARVLPLNYIRVLICSLTIYILTENQSVGKPKKPPKRELFGVLKISAEMAKRSRKQLPR